MQAVLPKIRPSFILRMGGVVTTWLVALSGLAVFCFTNSQGFCTSWGCSPAYRVLPVFHAAWLVALLPPMLVVASYGPPRLVRLLAVVVIVLGIGLGGYDTFAWAQARDVPLIECLQRWGYRLATSVVSLPLLPIPLSACLAFSVADRRSRQAAKKDDSKNYCAVTEISPRRIRCPLTSSS